MSWVTSRLGDVITLQRGHDLPDSQRQDGDVPVVSSSGITGRHAEAKAKPPGVVTGRYGTIGEVFYIEKDYWPLNTALYVTEFKGNHPRFVAYLLRNLLANFQSDKAAIPGVRTAPRNSTLQCCRKSKFLCRRSVSNGSFGKPPHHRMPYGTCWIDRTATCALPATCSSPA